MLMSVIRHSKMTLKESSTMELTESAIVMAAGLSDDERGDNDG
jgi:hypothetical protein